MVRKALCFVTVFFLFTVPQALAQSQEPAQAPSTPAPAQPQAAPAGAIAAATRSEVECSGFITATPVPSDVYVFDGADNDFRSPYRQYVTRDFVYLRTQKGSAAVGSEYRLVRQATASTIGSGGSQLPLFGRATWYSAQERSISSLGQAYEDVGRVKVIAVAPEGAVAEVTFACGLVAPDDLAIPYQAREIPTYDPSLKVDRFAPMKEGRKPGEIVAAAGNAGALGNGSLAYVSLGEGDGARPGQRYRILHADRDFVGGSWLSKPYQAPPAETVGELVILFAQERSSVGIVISNVREISLGDAVAPE